VTGQLPLSMPETQGEPAAAGTSVRQAVASALRAPQPATPAADDKPAESDSNA
jgi:hypothetical protein